MKKIMFNDRYGLTQAVLEGRKTMTRRIIPPIEIDWNRRGKVTLPISCFRMGYLFMDTSSIVNDLGEYIAPAKYQPKYNQGEIVAIAQSYKDVMEARGESGVSPLVAKAGYMNKMFVKADLMPHQIRITNVRIERLQDISDEDCRKEGIDYVGGYSESYYFGHGVENIRLGNSYCEAFAALIDKVSGKGTWESNPWVFVYEFELEK